MINNKPAGTGKPTLCIVNFNGKSVLPTSLSAACALADRFAAILVLDNGSVDGSAELAEREFNGVEVVSSAPILGAGAHATPA